VSTSPPRHRSPRASRRKSIAVGGVSTLTLVVVNPNAAPLTLSTALDDTLPSNVLVAAAFANVGTCGAANVTADAGTGLVRLADATPDRVRRLHVTVDVTSSVAGGHQRHCRRRASDHAGTNPQPAIDDLVVHAAVHRRSEVVWAARSTRAPAAD
jgi:hypothetical protein